MEKEFVPYELAVKLKALGFDEPCFIRVWWLNDVNNDTKRPFVPRITIYGKDIDFEYPMPESHPSSGFDALELQVPTFSQCFRWFREKYDLPSWIYTSNNKEFWYSVLKDGRMIVRDYKPFNTYEEAELACLTKLIEIIKTKQNA